MGNFNLDVNTPHEQDVASPSVLRADLGAGRTLLVISGVARPEWGLDTDQTQRPECLVRLRVPATHLEQSTVHVGLASVSNGESEFAFATDSTSLSIDENGELVLHTFLALAGEPSTLNRFGYQVVAVDHALATEITGTLTWPTAWFRPASTDPATLSGAFTIEVEERTFTPGPPGLGDVEHLTFLSFGTITSVTIGDDKTSATYRAGGVPVDKALKVVVNQSALTPPGDAGARMSPTAPGLDLVQLSAAQPTKSGVDFVAVRVGGPA
jgi:hypothetical protein